MKEKKISKFVIYCSKAIFSFVPLQKSKIFYFGLHLSAGKILIIIPSLPTKPNLQSPLLLYKTQNFIILKQAPVTLGENEAVRIQCYNTSDPS
jgi:hypothetical protein